MTPQQSASAPSPLWAWRIHYSSPNGRGMTYWYTPTSLMPDAIATFQSAFGAGIEVDRIQSLGQEQAE